MRTAITQARNAGVHLGFFTANTGYWKVRLEPDPWTGEPDRVMVGYKTTESGQPDPSGDPTTTWRDPQGANEPENALMGIAYIGDNDSLYFPLRVTAEQAADRLFRSTGLQGMPPGSYVDIGKELIGWEWDAVIDNGYTPQGLTVLAASPVTGGLLADAGRLRRPGAAFADTARYIAPSGAIVFTSGTIQWSWGLDLFEPDRRIQQITYNLLSDMGAQPVTPARDLVLDGEPISQIPTVESKTLTYGGPVIAGLQSRAVGRSVEFTWLTDQPALGQVWIVDPNGMVSMPAGEKVRTAHEDKYTTSHQLSFNGLPPVTEMHYQVLSTSESGYTTVSGVQDFTTGQASPKDRVVLALTPLKNQVVCEVKPALQNIKWQVRSQPILAGFAALAVLTASGVAILGVVRRAKSNRG
jgi:hypothetical protein